MERTNKLFGVTALFNTPDEIISAAKKVAESAYKKFDVNTPYPVHGMDPAMKLRPSKLGYITLIFGLSGMTFILLFMTWAMMSDYPLVIGGKPYFALPAFIPITFEVTVLLATLATVIGMLTFFFNFPQNKHPLNDTDYIKRVSVDKFGIVIEADNPGFDENKVKEFLASIGGQNIESVYYQVEETYPVFQPKFIVFLTLVALVVSGGTYFTLNKLMYMVPFDWMMEQDKVTVQEKSDFYADEFSVRPPVEGTVARGFLPYTHMGEANPTQVLSNPLPVTKKILELGKKKFLTYCSPCHGNFAEGDSRLHGQFPNPPTLHSNKVREMEDGMIYHIITNGQNAMPSYRRQISREERWAIVDYIRVLQRAKNAKASDLEMVKKEPQENAE